MDPKQEIFDILYQFKDGDVVLDVGCGYPVPSINLGGDVRDFSYTGLDLKINGDWYDFEPGDYDIIIVNDLFPNVDQRLELFLDKYLPHCKEVRLSLTYFDKPKWYRAERVDGDEILTMQAWNYKDLLSALAPHQGMRMHYPGTFPNGRRVLLVWLKGGLA